MKTKTLCRGCCYDFYNQRGDGCWSFERAEVCKRAFIHLSMVPPWNVRPVTTLNCHRRDRHIAVSAYHPQLTGGRKHVQKYDGGSY